jgi:hypothetical protein
VTENRTVTGSETLGAGDRTAIPSLLWPSGIPRGADGRASLSPELIADLDLEPILRVLGAGDARRMTFASWVLGDLTTDADTIAFRQEVLGNLLASRPLRDRLTETLPHLTELIDRARRPAQGYLWSVADVLERLALLEGYLTVVEELSDAFTTQPPTARGLRTLAETLRELVESAEFDVLQREVPRLRSELDDLKSVTIGVNLGDDLRPVSATILSLNGERMEGRHGPLGRMFGRETGERGVTRLRGAPGSSLRSFFPMLNVDAFGHEPEFVRDLRRLLEQLVAPIGESIERYAWVHARVFATLEAEIAYYLNAADLVERLRRTGLPICCPRITPPADRATEIDDGYNASLALRTAGAVPIVTSDIRFGGDVARVWILTGPNRGGKTTYIRAAGIAQVLAQAGLHVPARAARLSPVDAIFTHFPSREGATPGEGRLDDEAKRLAGIFAAATPQSLILLNEVLSGTSTVEALGLARDALQGLHLLGARTIYVTHLHDLTAAIDEINRDTEGDGSVGSLVAEIDDRPEVDDIARRTFRVRPGQPRGLSYASDIAEEHGISYAQVRRLLTERGVLDDGA